MTSPSLADLVHAAGCEIHSLVQADPKLMADLRGAVRPGEIVFEVSTFRSRFGRPSHACVESLGVLSRVQREPAISDEVWGAENPGGAPPLQDVHYIRAFDGTEVRWERGVFVKAPGTPALETLAGSAARAG